MTLAEILNGIEEQDPEATIYAEGGAAATAASRAVAAVEPDDGSVPAEAEGLHYLLEVSLARDVLAVWQNWRDGAVPTTDQKVEAVTYNAKNDAYQPST